MMTLLSRFAGDESGATSIEYALIATLIGMVMVVGATLLGVQLGAVYEGLAAVIPTPT